MSVDPWVHEWLKGRADEYRVYVGQAVTVYRFSQRPIAGEVMRAEPTGLVIAGHGVVPIELIDRIEAEGGRS